MSDYSEIKRLAEAAGSGQWGYDGSYVCPARTEDGTTYVESWRAVADCYQPENTKFIAAANPAAVLALIAENQALRKDAERYRFLRDKQEFMDAKFIVLDFDSGCCVEAMDWLSLERLDESIDCAMSKEPKAE